MKSMEHSAERSFGSLNESIHSLMGLKTHLTCNWVDSVRGIIDDNREEVEKQQLPDDSDAGISKIKGELEVLAACIKKLNVQRRQVLNELLDLKGNIRVFCRIRPISIANQKSVEALGSNEVLINLVDNKSKIYSFDKVFHPCSSQVTISSSPVAGLKFEDGVGALLTEESQRNIQPHNDSRLNALSIEEKGRFGHKRHQCKTPHKQSKKNENKSPSGSFNYVDKSYHSNEALALLSCVSEDECWVLDSGPSFHTTSNRGTFLTMSNVISARCILKMMNPVRSLGRDIGSEVFTEIEPIIKSALDGYNVCIFAYGQTGTGKTFTMEGTEEFPGVVPCAIEALFKHAADSNHSFLFSFSMLEIYMGYLKDLLIPHSQTTKSIFPLPPRLSIQTHPNGEIEIENLVTIQVNDLNQAMRLYKSGCGFRSTASTNSNRMSSRSHCMIRISISSFGASERRRLTNKLWMVDLGGSERVLKTKAVGRRFEEGKAINLSLSSLGDVIHSLQSKKRHIPYRNSKLTQVLKDSLGWQRAKWKTKGQAFIRILNAQSEDKGIEMLVHTYVYEVKAEKEVAINNLLQKMKKIEYNRNDVTQEIMKLNEKLGKLIVISPSSTELVDLSDVCIEGLGSNMRFQKSSVTSTPLADFPRFMRPTVCSQSKSGNAGVSIQALKSRASLPPRKGKGSSQCAESVAVPIEGTSECYSESSVSKISCLVGPTTNFSAENETEFSEDTSDSDIKVVVFAKQDLSERDSIHKKFNLRLSKKNHANTMERVSTQNHSKVGNWLQLHKCASNINRCTHKNKRILAIPISEKKARVRGRIVQDLHDEKVPDKELRKRNSNHRDAKSADMENHLNSELEEVNVSHAVLKNFVYYEKSSPACPACEIDAITVDGTQSQLLDSTTEVSECRSLSGPADLNDLKLIMPDVAYQERYNISESKLNSLSIDLIGSPSSSKKKPNYEEMHEMEESNLENMHVPGCVIAGIKPCCYELRSPSALSICKANQMDYCLVPKLLDNTRTGGFLNLLKPKVHILYSSILVALGFASLGLGHDFFYALTL
ncbi:hypothetical protein RND71_040531 [Anisodus tanguticus]|uniref:Kinesin motor domain-containing protein n=1 Tax=Anisodus tanguticus TaxID=243964 RepID=A0AAE1UVV3_9SOLA|nr:hypothetical protein RND71_040531 [Anisodus tanguticus]